MPSQKEIADMANFMNVLNEKSDEEYRRPDPAMNSNASNTLDPLSLQVEIKEQNTQAMAALLENVGDLLAEDDFVEHIQQAASRAADDVRADPTLRDSLKTQRTSTGFIYGEWELIERQDDQKTYFMIRHTGTAEILAKDLLLRESALSIVKLLNEGSPINSMSCFRALQADMKYKSALFDMINAKNKKGVVFEDRYTMARSKAVAAKKTAKTILEDLRRLK